MDAQTLVKEIRAAGLTQAEIAERIECAQSTVHAWESGDRGGVRGISGNFLIKLIELHKEVCVPPPQRKQKRAA